MIQKKANRDTNYRGRFAPSPTGPLHIGSLIAATASYLEARKQQGQWLVRIENIDPPREVPGASDDILHTLEKLGFEWDEQVVYQLNRGEAYEFALQQLLSNQQAYYCQCSRKQIATVATSGLNGPIYPRTCLHSSTRLEKGSLRFHTQDENVAFTDEILGPINQNVARESGDFVLKRIDGLFAYQLAVVVDDAWQGINNIVRGSDLLDLTAGQIQLQQALGLESIRYAHFPVITNEQGQKLSKQTGATAIDSHKATQQLYHCLDFLGQRPPAELKHETLEIFWDWAKHHWNIANIPKQRSIKQ